MKAAWRLGSAVKWLATGASLAAASYAAYAGTRWYRYGDPKPPRDGEEDPLLDRFMPEYEVVERHQIRVAAPPDVTFAAACAMDLRRSGVTRALMRGREMILGSEPREEALPVGLIDMAQAIGWGILAERPDHEVVVGGITQPWRADVEFRSLPPDEFAAFNEPGWVKIAWTLRADPGGDGESMFRTETRATTTDAASRAAFRRYWSLFSPGIVFIRRVSLGLLKAEAERRAMTAGAEGRGATPETGSDQAAPRWEAGS
jgi:hypothetical protein